jgi:uncharacterized membrane protein HdeD (DUF308 family)
MTDHVEPAEETAAGDLTEATPHPLAGKAFWLAIGSLGLILSGAALVAAPIVAGPEGLGWFGAAFACAGLALMLEAFALPGWGGATGLVIEAMALLLGGLLLLFTPFFLTAPLTLTVAATLAGAAVGAALCGIGAMGARGWTPPLLGAAGFAAAAAAIHLYAPPQEAMLPCFAAGAALLFAGLSATARAFVPRPAQAD